MTGKENIREIVEDLLSGSDKFLVDILVQPGERISVFIDGDLGVTIDDCRKISRSLEDRLSMMPGNYELNVSSAGLDRPLRLVRQYRKNTGRKMEILTNDGEKIEGSLSRVTDSGIEIMPFVKDKKKPEEPEKISLLFGDIKTAKVKPDFGKKAI